MTQTKNHSCQEFSRAVEIEVAMRKGRQARSEALATILRSGTISGKGRKAWGTLFRVLNPRKRNYTAPAIYADC